MSLFSRPPHEITVYPVVDVDDGYGGTQPGEGPPVVIRALVQPLANGGRQEEGNRTSAGYDDEANFQVVARSLPGGPWSRVTWNGDDFVIVGEPRRYSASPATNHHIVTIRKR